MVALRRWMVAWLLFSIVIQGYDALYIVLKPLTLEGHALGSLYPAHHLYSTVDRRYGSLDAFVIAQSWANLVEVLASLWVLTRRATRVGVLGALVLSTATFWKTVLYFLVEICGGFEFTQHVLAQGRSGAFVFMYVLPNAVWLVMPAAMIIACLRMLAKGP